MSNGTITYNNGDVFTGIQESLTKRVGVYRSPDVDVYTGRFDKENGHGEMIVNSAPDKYIYKGQMRKGQRHGSGIMKIMSGPLNGERYRAMFKEGWEVRKSRNPIVKEEEEEDMSPGGGGRRQTKRRVVKHSKRRVVKHSKRRVVKMWSQ